MTWKFFQQRLLVACALPFVSPIGLKAAEIASTNDAGAQALQIFLAANQHWLRPSLEDRRGLIYEYRQENPYRERVYFDFKGNLFARLEASKQSPNQPTRQRLWIADGRAMSGNVADAYVKIEAATSVPDRLNQHLAMGLALDCALTRLARETNAFRAEKLPGDIPGQYRLKLHARKDARLFAGTMLGFTSWAYMHDVRFDRSEIICDAATHRPLHERDFSGAELKGEFYFEDWLNTGRGDAPGKIRAMIPYEKKGEDQTLEMMAEFQLMPPNVWLLKQVQSSFRGAGGGSTGTVTIAAVQQNSFAPVAEALAQVKQTEQTLAAIQESSESPRKLNFIHNDWQITPLKAAWTDEARSFEKDDDQTGNESFVGIYRTRMTPLPDGEMRLDLEGVSTANWKEFDTEWKASWLDSSRNLTSVATNALVRAENVPGQFVVSLTVPSSAASSGSREIFLEGTVKRMTAMYHGHGRWFHLTGK